MATSLMNHPCGDACNQEAQFKVSFGVKSLEMSDKEKKKMFESILIVTTWDRNVIKLNCEENSETFSKVMDWIFLSTSVDLSKKLKFCPIMIDLSRACTELGTVKCTLSDCFCDAIMCEGFNSQTVSNEFKFVKDEVENATMHAYFRVQKLLDDGINGNLQKQIKTKMIQQAKRKKKASAGIVENEDYESDSEDEPSKDFTSPDELTENGMSLADLNVYRIINGILINTKDKTGPCGEKCPVAAKYIKELNKDSKQTAVTSTRSNFQKDSSKCAELFKSSPCDCSFQSKPCETICPECGGVLTGKPQCVPKVPLKREPNNTWIDRNIQEEELLKNICKKYGIKVDDMKGIDQQVEQKAFKKKNKKKKIKRVKNSRMVFAEKLSE